MGVVTTIQVQFGSESADDGFLSAEVDGRDDVAGGLNNGDTSFMPGDTAFFLVYYSQYVSIDSVVASAGQVVSAPGGLVDQEEDLIFSDSNNAQLSKPATGAVSLTWYGNNLGAFTLGDDQRTITCQNKGVAVARANYQAAALAYGIHAPQTLAGKTDFQIAVVVTGSNNPPS